MATNLGTVTLATVMANARGQARSLSAQESGILDIQLTDLVHDAILYVRGVYGKLVDNWYRTRYTALTFTGTNPLYTVDVSSLSMTDIDRLRLLDATLGEIPIVPNAEFNGIRTNYTPTQIGTTKGVATVASLGGTMASKSANPPISILLYTNAAAAPSTVELWITRNPIKVLSSAPTDTLDMPDHLSALVQDVTVVYILNRLGQQIPQQLESKVTLQLQSALQQLNLQLTPNPKQAA